MKSVSRRTAVRAIALATTLVLFTTLPAFSHPFVRGGEAPVDSLATLTLAMAHGCGTEQAAGGDPTREVAMEVPEELRIVAVAPEQGWDVVFEADDDGSIAVVVWTATTAMEPAPDFMFDAVVAGEPGDEMYLRVFQECDDFAYRWIGTPDQPASDPAVRIRLTPADPASPPPPEDVTPIESPDEAASDPTPDEQQPQEQSGGSAPTEPDTPSAESVDPTVAADTDAGDGATEDGGSTGRVLLLGAGGLVLAGLAMAGLRKRSAGR